MLAHTCKSAGELAARASTRSGFSDILRSVCSFSSAISGDGAAHAMTGRSQPASCRFVNTRTAEEALSPPRIQWVFLGPPGVGKGTYSTRVAIALGVAHIAAGDLVRHEMRSGTKVGKEMELIVNKGNLLPDQMITELLVRRIEKGKEAGEKGFVLDGFPRTVQQAQDLMEAHDVQLAVNLALRQEVLIEKCMGRRICRKCGKGWNLADIFLPAEGDRPQIIMPPLDPPVDCLAYMEQREDDKEDVIRRRLEVHNELAKPVANFFQSHDKLLDFEITGGIPETLPLLYNALKPHAGNWTIADFEVGTSATIGTRALG